jgi:hypothetical protein
MIHRYHQGSVKLCVAEKLNRMRIRVPGELEPVTLQEKNLETFKD